MTNDIQQINDDIKAAEIRGYDAAMNDFRGEVSALNNIGGEALIGKRETLTLLALTLAMTNHFLSFIEKRGK